MSAPNKTIDGHGLSAPERKAWQEATEWISARYDEVCAAMYLAQRKARYAFVIIDWHERTPDKIPLFVAGFTSSAAMVKGIKGLQLGDSATRSLIRNVRAFGSNPSRACVILRIEQHLTRTLVIEPPDSLTNQDVFEKDPERYLAKINYMAPQ